MKTDDLSPGLRLIDLLVVIYQHTLSPDHGPLRSLWPQGACRWQPTCSNYLRQAMRKHGWYGILMGGKRVLHCHPWTAGGIDPV